MRKKNSTRPPEGTPEFKEWLKNQIKKDAEELFGENKKNSDFDEAGVLSGNEGLLAKSDSELFPDELEEYTPEERRNKFKVHKKEEK